jgi:hypothetical protein
VSFLCKNKESHAKDQFLNFTDDRGCQAYSKSIKDWIEKAKSLFEVSFSNPIYHLILLMSGNLPALVGKETIGRRRRPS